MESSSWPESLRTNRIKAIQELTKGQVLTNNLREMLDQPEKIESDIKSVNGVVAQILGMFDNTLSIMDSSNLISEPHNPINDLRPPNIKDDQKPKVSEVSDESIKTKTLRKTKRGCYNKRKNTWTSTNVTFDLIDDGYAWRKYGQKTILNSKHQRNYYRCSHKFEQGCQATKQVQKINDKPSKYKITYNGRHTCNNLQRSQIIVETPNPSDNTILINFETNTFTENNKVNSCFPSMEHTHKEGFPSLGHLKCKEVSSYEYHTLWDPTVGLSQVSSKSMPLMSYGEDYEEMVSPGIFSSTCSTHDYENDTTEGRDLDDFFFDF
ncbi:putative transcription factor WRKY family [Helianthus annuus]|nr:putative transcription factor WRKY family [Helianthus annuus]